MRFKHQNYTQPFRTWCESSKIRGLEYGFVSEKKAYPVHAIRAYTGKRVVVRVINLGVMDGRKCRFYHVKTIPLPIEWQTEWAQEPVSHDIQLRLWGDQ